MTYAEQAFSYVASQKATIDNVASVLGIRGTAIAGAMAEEHDSIVGSGLVNRNLHLGLDGYAISELKSHDDVMAAYPQAKNVEAARVAANQPQTLWDKLTNPALIDAGPANIKIATAVDLMQGYKRDYLDKGVDPLDMAKYDQHYDVLVRDMANMSGDLTPKLTGLMLKEAKEFFNGYAHPDFWNSQTPDFQDAVYITYFNNGRAAIEKKYREDVEAGVSYEPLPGGGTSGGLTFLDNLNSIREALANPAQWLSSFPFWWESPMGGLFDLEVGPFDLRGPSIDPLTATAFTLATEVLPPRRDPLILDLDADGFETIGIDTTNPILFDHDGDSIQTATGWVKPDDAFLVLDRNGNGTIDDGTELFGDSTPLYAGGVAADGFAALAQEDSNLDGKVDSQDANWTSLRLWRDLNQDGNSQAGELFTLEETGIAALNVAKTENAIVLANGNQIADLGGFVRSDGSGGTLGTAEQLADVDLASNPFFSEFTDSIPLTEAAQTLPDMDGAGQVRDLREAASLTSPAGEALAAQLAAFAADTTRAGQLAQLDGLLKAWADTSAMITTAEAAGSGTSVIVGFADVGTGSPAYQAWLDKLSILERFNGQTFLPLPASGGSLTIDFFVQREALLNTSYANLKESVYAGLVMQTRLKPYLDDIALTIDETGIALDYTAMVARLDARKDADPTNAVLDLIDLQRYAGTTLPGWDGLGQLETWIDDPASGSGVLAALAGEGLAHAGVWSGTLGGDIAFGSEGVDQFNGGDGNDVLAGAGGNDILFGGNGDDFLSGGAGNDTLFGGSSFTGAGNDTYRFGAGSGQDTINDNDAAAGNVDTIKIIGLTPSEITLAREWASSGVPTNDLLIKVTGSTDSLRVTNYFYGSGFKIEKLMFDDGTVWTTAEMDAAPFDLRASTDSTVVRGGSYTNGNDIYLWGTGSGQDTINDNDAAASNVDTIKIIGVAPSEVTVTRVTPTNNLVISINGTTETLTVQNYFFNDSYKIEGVRFDDGTVWTSAELNAAVLNAQPTGTLTIGGTAAQNQTLSVTNTLGDTDGLGAMNYQWQSSLNGTAWSDVVGAIGLAFTLTEAQVGSQVRVRATYIDGHGVSETRISAATTAIANVNDAPTGIVGVGGTATQDQVLAASNTLADMDGLGSIGYQWQFFDDAGTTWEDIVGATSETFTLTEAQVEKQVRTVASYVDGHGTIESVASAATAAVRDLIIGTAGADNLSGIVAANQFEGLDGDDTYIVDNEGDLVIENLAEGMDLVQSSVSYALAANVEDLTLTGTAAINGTGNALGNILTGNAANNTLTGNGGNDTLDGGTGADTMRGGAGNDSYVVDSSGDRVTEYSGEGTDLVQASVSHTLAANVENLTLTGAAAITGTGNNSNNVVTGNAANNTLTGGAGDDILDGGAGADTLRGGTGDDSYVVDSAGDSVTEYGGEGTDLVQSSVTRTLSDYIENLTLTGTAAINGTGNDSNNVLVGNAAANTLNGGYGSDTMRGGAGNDTYVVDYASDVVMENPDEGIDLVRSSESWTLGDNVENLALTGSDYINGTGNALDNVLTGNGAENTLIGSAGNDTLDGGSNDDRMRGGAGNDIYVVDHTGDVVTEYADEGTDLVQSSVSRTLGANVEKLILVGTAAINGTGNTLANVLNGNAAANMLNGGAGADTMLGGAGDDIYVVDNAGDVVTENAGEGNDLVQVSFSYTLGANVENLTLTGTAAINGIGNELDNVLTGNAAANTLTGGAGNDTYVVDNVGDVVVENADEGTDLVQSSVTWILGAHFENLTLTGTAAIDGTGNTLDNVLTGNAANNTLTGGAGNDSLDGGSGTDTMRGGAGDDTYVVDYPSDVVTENAGEGTDLVQSSVTRTLGANIENLTLIGTASIDGTGNTLDNVLIGNAANNSLVGGAGNDTLDGGSGSDAMRGGTGDDTYVVNSTGDGITEYGGEGIDLVLASISYTLSTTLNNLTLTGTAAIDGTGNDWDNVLTGNTANNTLTGYAGNDRLDGGAGTDSLIGGVGNDTYVLGLGYGADSVQDSDATAGNTDAAEFLAGIAAEQIWLRQVGNNLEASIIGTSDKLTLKNWYLGSQYHVEQFHTADGKLLLDSQVENLVQAMAAFAPPGAGQTTLPPAYQEALAPVIAANWQ